MKGNWWIAGYDENKQNYDYAMAELGSLMGTCWQLTDHIEYLYRETPKYVILKTPKIGDFRAKTPDVKTMVFHDKNPKFQSAVTFSLLNIF